MQDKEKMFLDLNSVLVKVWIENNRPDKAVKIELLERMLNWYKKMGYVTLDKQEEDKLPEGLEEAAEKHISNVFDAVGHPGWDWEMQDVLDAFKAGAKWQAEQGESYTAEVIMLPVGIKKIQHTVEGFEPGEEVIVQIRKK